MSSQLLSEREIRTPDRKGNSGRDLSYFILFLLDWSGLLSAQKPLVRIFSELYTDNNHCLVNQHSYAMLPFFPVI